MQTTDKPYEQYQTKKGGWTNLMWDLTEVSSLYSYKGSNRRCWRDLVTHNKRQTLQKWKNNSQDMGVKSMG